ncbi:hypothetical protein E2C01_055554 [Portunus trituberculatus]|uniref:Uncharacterized protein n=1 Tax=Portunus trituberculatus TaxID=210409 RepID=A0A5B7GRI5_PORTR|nr:hypothetical protein [Portunus trituberculatus]
MLRFITAPYPPTGTSSQNSPKVRKKLKHVSNSSSILSSSLLMVHFPRPCIPRGVSGIQVRHSVTCPSSQRGHSHWPHIRVFIASSSSTPTASPPPLAPLRTLGYIPGVFLSLSA